MNSEITQLYKKILIELNLENILDDIDESAAKAASLLAEWTVAAKQPPPQIRPLPAPENPDWITIENIHYYSLCQHDFVPFFGTASIAYLPDKKIAGFGTFPKTLHHLTKIPQFQETLTQKIADTLQNALQPRALLIRLTARHLCLEMRINSPQTTCTTLAARGLCQNPEIRNLAISLLTST